jgi:hypothetical protein
MNPKLSSHHASDPRGSLPNGAADDALSAVSDLNTGERMEATTDQVVVVAQALTADITLAFVAHVAADVAAAE